MKYVNFFAGILLITPFIASAADPSVASFVSGSNSIYSAQIASFSWNVANSGGYSFSIPCTQGIKFKKTDGSVFPCDTPLSSTLTSIDGIDLSVWNLSGATKSFTARITPKDASGIDFSSARQDIQVYVAPLAHPIENITGATTASSSSPYTLSWSGSLIDGVNLSVSCAPTIRITSSSYPQGDIPCNTPLFTNGLPGTGSIVLSFNNNDSSSKSITLTLTPMMAPGVYNGIQTESVTVLVNSNIIPDAITTSFTTGTSTNLGRSPEGTPIPLSWTTTTTDGANINISCNEHIVTTITTATASSTPKCATPAFNPPLPPNGTATVIFSNNSFASEQITLTLMPMLKNGGFDATRGKELSFRILPKGVPAVASPTTAALISQVVVPPTPTSTSSFSSSKKVFTKNLVRGSSGAEVRALQEFLKKDRAIYPEGVVNGTFGPATERAVKRFQSKYNLGGIGTPGYGGVGPKTRDILNSLNK